jgi:hypothetical protein
MVALRVTMSGIYFKLECPRNLSVLIRYQFVQFIFKHYRLVSGGRKFIHGFSAVLTTVWYLEDLNSFMVLMGF